MDERLAQLGAWFRAHDGERRLVAIDGRCGSGKTTFASALQNEFGCTVFHMDDYFPQPFQRTPQRLQTPGGNVDFERFREEILLPLLGGAETIRYHAYDCVTQTLRPPTEVRPGNRIVIEGSYSCHPALWDYYDLRVFLTVDAETQRQRILLRNGDAKWNDFATRWIPMEEAYFAAYRIGERCDLCFETTETRKTPSHGLS